jgi:hypothetical protein
MIKRINALGLCEKCNRLIKPYYITRKKCLCFKHLNKNEQEEVSKFDRLKKLVEKKKEELENSRKILSYVEKAYKKGYEDGRKGVIKYG